MKLHRLFAGMLLAFAGFALMPRPVEVAARQPGKDDIPKRPSNYSDVSAFKNMAGIPAADMKKAKDAFTAFAKYNAEYVSHPRVYTAPQEFITPKAKDGSPIYTVDELVNEMNRHILVPLPDSRIGPDNADYIRELGVALDAAFKEIIETHGERVVRVNATRMLAAACRSGATAHYATVTGLISNANTFPDVRYYAFQAAGNLLAAYDLNDYLSRKHSNKSKEVSDLVAALQKAVTDPNMLVTLPAGTNLTKQQVDVVTFIRRQAIRALGDCRFSEKAPGVPAGPSLYPAFTLAQVAVSDPAINPAPTDSEVAEAVIGLCNMTPPLKGTQRDPYAQAMSDAVATGIITFATKRAASPLDKSLAWKGYGSRMNEAVKGWKARFDPGFNPARPTAFLAAAVPQIVTDFVAEADRRVLAPMESGAGTVDVPGLRQYRDNTMRGNKNWTLSPFVENPKLTLAKKN